MNRTNRTWYVVFVVFGLLMFVGCRGKSKPVIPATSFQMTVKDIVNWDSLVVKHLVITAHGKRIVKVTVDGSIWEATIDPDTKTDLMTAELAMVANLVAFSDPTQNQLTCLLQVKGPRVIVGGPGQYPAPSAKHLKDLVTFSAAPGDYPVGQDVEIGTMQGRKIVLNVK